MFFCKDLIGQQASPEKNPEPCLCCAGLGNEDELPLEVLQGLGPQGLGPQILGPQGVGPQGVGPQGLPLPLITNLLPPEVMVCYRTETTKKGAKSGNKRTRDPRRKRAKSRELRGGILYTGCDCEKRNGLQDDCRRTGCQGSPECLTKPDPICGPSEFSNGKHLGLNRFHQDGSGGDFDENGNEKITVHYKCIPVTLEAIKAM